MKNKEILFNEQQFEAWVIVQSAQNDLANSIKRIFDEANIEGIDFEENFREIIENPFDTVWPHYNRAIEKSSGGIDYVRQKIEPDVIEKLRNFERRVNQSKEMQNNWIYNKSVTYRLQPKYKHLVSLENTIYDEKAGKFITCPQKEEEIKKQFYIELTPVQKEVHDKLTAIHDAINDLARYIPRGEFYHDVRDFKHSLIDFNEEKGLHEPYSENLFNLIDVAIKPAD